MAEIIAYIAAALVSAALGYYWGRREIDDAYTEGVEDGIRIRESAHIHLVRRIRDLEWENASLKVRLNDESGSDIEDQYIEEENE